MLLGPAAAFSQSKISPSGRHAIAAFQRQSAQSRAGLEAPQTGMIVRLAEGCDVSALTDAGFEVVADLGGMAVVRAAITDAERMAEMPQVRSISFGQKRRLLMDAARSASGVDAAHNGITVAGQTTSFTGAGVILGVMDSGLDPNHVNFSGRVERLWHYKSADGTATAYTGSTVGGFSTDDAQETHGTHVTGIMAGGYRGNVTTYSASSGTGNPYYGVAPEAALAISCGELYDANILAGVEQIISYAETQGKPVAVNLSLGSNGGPMDGTDDFSVALDRLGERGIICVAAGNEGADNISIEKTFTASDNTVKTILYYNNRLVTSNIGTLDIWASDGTALTVKIGNVSSTGTVSNETTLVTNATSERTITKGVKSTGGYIYYTTGVDANNGRYNANLYFDESLPSTGRFAITVSGKAGQKVNITFSGYSALSNRYNGTSGTVLSGYTTGNPDNSINSMACGKNVLSVGAYSTQTSYRSLDGTLSTSGETLGSHASFSSYGKDFFDRKLPETSAPGTVIMSSFSTPYIKAGNGDDYGESADDMVAKVTSGSSTYYWGPMEGTSMATPYVTGVMGLWLQADPTLTMADVRDVLQKTSSTDSYTQAAPDRFGYGKIDAGKGLEYILTKASIGTVTDDNRAVVVLPTASGYDITAAGASRLSARLYDLQGRTVAEAYAAGNSLSLDASGVTGGIYVLRVSGDNFSWSTKITH